MAIFFIVFLTIAGINVRAHPPDDMTLVYNSTTNKLSVTIIHGVSDGSTHYISSVEVKVNGTIDNTYLYASQSDLNTIVKVYDLTTNEGSTITVTATCIIGGSLTKTLGGPSTPGGDGIPGYLGIYLIVGVSLIAFLTLIRRKTKKINF